MKKILPLRHVAALFASTLLLAACGGGGGGKNDAVTPPSTRFGASTQFEGTPGDPASCSLEREKRFVRSYIDEVYLWYNEVPEINSALYSDPIAYFDALTNLPLDKGFSAAIRTGSAGNLVAQSMAPAQANHTPYVPVARVDTTADGRRVGYIDFRDHAAGAQDDLITAFTQVRNGGAQDLILDLRSNSGGFLYIARTAASMITGPGSQDRVFEQLRYNDKRNVLSELPQSTFRFSSAVQDGEVQYPTGTPLPQLNLPRVYILTSKDTCSSSESIINSLRGIDVQVILVGNGTCGKPYGFHEKANCGISYFPIEFKGTNAKGFGDYIDGFAPTCAVAASPGVVPGSATDPLYAAAQFHIATGTCPPAPATASASPAAASSPQQASRPAWLGRLVQP